MISRRIFAEVVIKAHHAVNLCPAEIQPLGDNRKGVLGDVAERGLNAVQDRQERPFGFRMTIKDFFNPFLGLRRIKH